MKVWRKPASASTDVLDEYSISKGAVDVIFEGVSPADREFVNRTVASYLAQRMSVGDSVLRHRLYSKLWHRDEKTKSSECRSALARCGANLWDRFAQVE